MIVERLRFAPSPTGYLHVGGARTALFNYLYAKKVDGVFILRIEDTDPERSKPEYSEQILRSMEWLGLYWDEGPYYQSKRMERYREVAQYLLDNGLAYECFCTPEELEARRKEAQKQGKPYKYDRRCLHLSKEEKEKLRAEGRKPAIRIKLPDEDPNKEIKWHDLVKGDISFKITELDDFIILRSDGTPTYNFAVVVDDHDMGITLVMRGEDHISNTPKQIILYELLGWEVPKFAHIPMILGEDKTKLSKRHGAVSVEEYKNQGYISKAMFNFLALLGASYEENREIYEPQELIELFEIENISSHPAVFDHDKLRHINREHIKRLPMEELKMELTPFIEERGYTWPENWETVLTLLRERSYTLLDFVDRGDFFFTEDFTWDEKAKKQWEKGKDMINALPDLAQKFEDIDNWNAENIEKAMREVASEKGLKPRKFFPIIRIAVSGKTVGPSLFHMLEAIPKETVIMRLKKAVNVE